MYTYTYMYMYVCNCIIMCNLIGNGPDGTYTHT